MNSYKQAVIKYKYKNYAHFDEKINASQKVHFYISNPQNITRHAFYPLIHYKKHNIKFKNGERIVKTRDIKYAAHIDRYIYQYYAHMFNEAYNNVISNSIDENITAYRTNKKGLNNIHFAKEVFEFISEGDCVLLVGDFQSFFDTLGHRNLKNKLKKTLQVEELTDDVYSVYKSVVYHSYIELSAIEDYYEIHYGMKKSQFKKIQKYFDGNFNEVKKDLFLKTETTKEKFGIPQGTPLSGVLSNIYMMDFDEEMKRFADENKGLYRRYSDDFVLVVPKRGEISEDILLGFVKGLLSKDGFLEIQDEKLSVCYSINKEIYENEGSEPISIDYLGFVFDGKKVTIREKSYSKFYYKAYSIIDRELEIERKRKTKGFGRRSKKRIMRKYKLSNNSRHNENEEKTFLDYVSRAQIIMKSSKFEFDVQGFPENYKAKLYKRLSVR